MNFKANSAQITKLRELTKLSQEKFRERTAFSKRTLSALENESEDRHSYDTFVRLADAFTELLKENIEQARRYETQSLRHAVTKSSELLRQRWADRRRLLEQYLPMSADSLIDHEAETSKEFGAPYEFRMITNDVTLDIRDLAGATVFYRKESRIRILRENAYYYVEDMWADGSQSNFEVSPGVVGPVEEGAGRRLIKTTFGCQRKEGDEFDRVFKCCFCNSFCSSKEYWVERQTYPTDEFSVTILFPHGRPALSQVAVLMQGTYIAPCAQATAQIIDGRPALVWRIKDPMFKENYKLEWVW